MAALEAECHYIPAEKAELLEYRGSQAASEVPVSRAGAGLKVFVFSEYHLEEVLVFFECPLMEIVVFFECLRKVFVVFFECPLKIFVLFFEYRSRIDMLEKLVVNCLCPIECLPSFSFGSHLEQPLVYRHSIAVSGSNLFECFLHRYCNLVLDTVYQSWVSLYQAYQGV